MFGFPICSCTINPSTISRLDNQHSLANIYLFKKWDLTISTLIFRISIVEEEVCKVHLVLHIYNTIPITIDVHHKIVHKRSSWKRGILLLIFVIIVENQTHNLQKKNYLLSQPWDNKVFHKLRVLLLAFSTLGDYFPKNSFVQVSTFLYHTKWHVQNLFNIMICVLK